MNAAAVAPVWGIWMLRLLGGRALRARCLALAAAIAAVLAWPGSAVASPTDHPASSVLSPTAGSVLPLDTPVIISGGADNGEQGGIVLVEVSIDGGGWEPAEGTERWRYVFTPGEPGPITIRSRAWTLDTVEQPTRTVTVYAGSGSPPPVTCPCNFWMPSLLDSGYVIDEQDPEPVEVGLRFRTDRNGYVTGLLFWRPPANTGPQV